jgi:hypothetical protein
VFARAAEQLRELWSEVGKKPQKGTSILQFGLLRVRREVGVEPLEPVFWLKASRVGHCSEQELLLDFFG